MDNRTRRAALNRARAKALEHAELAEQLADHEGHGAMANVWSNVAQALKDGDPEHDKVDGVPSLADLRAALGDGSP